VCLSVGQDGVAVVVLAIHTKGEGGLELAEDVLGEDSHDSSRSAMSHAEESAPGSVELLQPKTSHSPSRSVQRLGAAFHSEHRTWRQRYLSSTRAVGRWKSGRVRQLQTAQRHLKGVDPPCRWKRPSHSSG
jgi:hypothetical protein